MTASVPPNPKLGKSQALNIAQATTTRLASLIPNVATELSPVTIYQPGAGSITFGVAPGEPPSVVDSYGVWVAPDLNGDGSTWYATVECFGAGGGGGGGNIAQGGGGGGGAEYAREEQYPIQPGTSYAYVCGLQGSGGFNNSGGTGGQGTAGTSGTTTVFDLAGVGLAGGVVANGGGGGDMTSVGIGGLGGTGSGNSIHFDGGDGGTNVSGNGSDNPVALASTSGMFVGNTLDSLIIPTWYIMNDVRGPSNRNDATGNGHTGTWTNFTSPGFFTGGTNPPQAPAQVPAYTSTAGTYGPNATTAGWISAFYEKAASSASARFTANVPGFSGTRLTVSCWVQASQGTWGNTPAGTFAVVAANSTNLTFASFKGYALYFFNNAGTWQVYAQVGNGTTRYTINSGAMPPTPGTWYHVVMTYDTGLLSLYVNGSLVASTTTTGYTSVPAGAFNTCLGLDPHVTSGWFFGSISNIWWATDCATSTLVNQAFGLTAATGGAGGGASGGPSAAGGNGASASGAAGGNGGTPAIQPASLIDVTTAAMGGFSGANANSTNTSPLTPSGGPYGGGGGGSGDMASPPALTTLTYQFPAAATYAGVDAQAGPGSPYNTNQQANPSSGVNTLLYAGGLASDTSSGSKNSLLLLPAGIQAAIGSATYTITNVLLTVTNAFPANPVESVLEIGYSSDTTLPQTYTGASLIDYVAAIEIPPGAGTITYDLTQTTLPAELANGTATALVLGPGNNPTFDAYNAPTGPQFYASVYGPGAFDTSNNPLYPYLTVILQKTITTQQGSGGASGGIIVISVNSGETPVAFVEPFAGTDAGGNQYAQGFTGPVTAWDPSNITPGGFTPETWHSVAPNTGWAASGSGYNGFWVRLNPDGFAEAVFDLTAGAGVTTTVVAAGVISSAYYPSGAAGGVNAGTVCPYGTLPAALRVPYLEVANNGQVILWNGGALAANLSIAGHIRWWPGTV